MVYKLITSNDRKRLPRVLPAEVMEEILTGLTMLDESYGDNRGMEDDGGYILLAENIEDMEEVRNYIDYDAYPCEYIRTIGSDYISAVYILNNECAVNVICPLSAAPQVLRAELEG